MAEVDGTEDVWGRKVCRLELGVKLSMLPRTLSASPAATSSWLKSWVASMTSRTLRPIDCVSSSNCCSSIVSCCNSSAVCAACSEASAAVSSSIYTHDVDVKINYLQIMTFFHMDLRKPFAFICLLSLTHCGREPLGLSDTGFERVDALPVTQPTRHWRELEALIANQHKSPTHLILSWCNN